MTNIVVLIGRLARPATLRQLPSGSRLVEYQLTVPRPGERAESVPVVWEDPPASAVDYSANDEVVVVGRVRRRFFRTAARTESRTEVVAEKVVLAKHAKRVEAVDGSPRSHRRSPGVTPFLSGQEQARAES